MFTPQAPRLPTGAFFMVGVGEDHGLSAESTLAGTGLCAEDLTDPSRTLSAAQELAVVDNLIGALGDVPGLGLEAGCRFRLTSYGMWALALVSSATARDAVEVATQFVELTFAFTDVTVRENAEELQVLFRPNGLPVRLQRFLVERDVAGGFVLLGDVLGAAPPVSRITFTAPRPLSMAPYLESFGLEPEFDAAENLLVVDASLMNVTLPQANEVTRRLALTECRRLLEQRRARTGLSGQVRDILVAEIAEAPNATRVARSLSMSDRMLRHHLAEEGTSFRVLLSEVRERLAEELLLTAGLPVAAVSQRLGYVEVSSFSQAFRRWKGIGPREFRETARRDAGRVSELDRAAPHRPLRHGVPPPAG